MWMRHWRAEEFFWRVFPNYLRKEEKAGNVRKRGYLKGILQNGLTLFSLTKLYIYLTHLKDLIKETLKRKTTYLKQSREIIIILLLNWY